jgi:hypothetical protein
MLIIAVSYPLPLALLFFGDIIMHMNRFFLMLLGIVLLLSGPGGMS